MKLITINVKKETWEELNKNKKAGETFDDVINRLAIEKEEKEYETENQTNNQESQEISQ